MRVSDARFAPVLGTDFAVGYRRTDVSDLVKGLEYVAAMEASAEMSTRAENMIEELHAPGIFGDGLATIRIRRDVKGVRPPLRVIDCDTTKVLTLIAAVAAGHLEQLEAVLENLAASGIEVIPTVVGDGMLSVAVFGSSVGIKLGVAPVGFITVNYCSALSL